MTAGDGRVGYIITIRVPWPAALRAEALRRQALRRRATPAYSIGQLVRPDGTVLTEGEAYPAVGPDFGYTWGREYNDPIFGPVYARWRYENEDEWRLVWYFPNGPGQLPRFEDNTGAGNFLPFRPGDPLPPSREAKALRIVRQ